MLHVRFVAPDQEVFSGEAQSVSSVNSAGPFDILPGHGKFVTLVENKPIIIRMGNGSKQTYTFPLAIIHVREDKVDAYVNPVQGVVSQINKP